MIGPMGGGGGLAPGIQVPGLPNSLPGMPGMPMGMPGLPMMPMMPMMGGIRGAMGMLPAFGMRPGIPGMGVPGLTMA